MAIPTCHYVATGSAAPVDSGGYPLVVVAIEEPVNSARGGVLLEFR